MTGRQESTQHVNESVGNLTVQTETGACAHFTTESIPTAGGHLLQGSPDPRFVQQNERCTENTARPPPAPNTHPPGTASHSSAPSSRVSTASRPSSARGGGPAGGDPPTSLTSGVPLGPTRRKRGFTSHRRDTETTAGARRRRPVKMLQRKRETVQAAGGHAGRQDATQRWGRGLRKPAWRYEEIGAVEGRNDPTHGREGQS